MSCPVCKSKGIYAHPYNGRSKIFHEKEIFQCKICELHYVQPMPSSSDIEKYNKMYFYNAHGAVKLASGASIFFQSIAKIRYEYIVQNSNLNEKSSINVLEIGPGYGHLATVIKEKSPVSKYYAVESDESCHHALDIIGVSLISDTSNLKEKVDIIIMSHVLEHQADPLLFILDYLPILRCGGLLFIDVPCMDFLHKTEPEPHTLFFNKKSMTKLVKLADLDLIDCNNFGISISSILKDKQNRFTSKFKTSEITDKKKSIVYKDLGLSRSLEPNELISITSLMPHLQCQVESWWLRSLSVK